MPSALAQTRALVEEAVSMKEKTLEALVASPPEREALVVQLFVRGGAQWGELLRERGQPVLELYGVGAQPLRRLEVEGLSEASLGATLVELGWALDRCEALEVVQLATEALARRLG